MTTNSSVIRAEEKKNNKLTYCDLTKAKQIPMKRKKRSSVKEIAKESVNVFIAQK